MILDALAKSAAILTFGQASNSVNTLSVSILLQDLEFLSPVTHVLMSVLTCCLGQLRDASRAFVSGNFTGNGDLSFQYEYCIAVK